MDNRGAQIQARGILGEIPIEGNEDFTQALVCPAARLIDRPVRATEKRPGFLSGAQDSSDQRAWRSTALG